MIRRGFGAFLFSVLLAACSETEIDTMAACEDAGGHVIPSPGTPISCPNGEEHIGNIPFGVEGAICCQ